MASKFTGAAGLLLVVAFILGQSFSVVAFKQQLWFYFEYDYTGDALYFETHQPDLSRYREIFPLVKSVCVRGWWETFTEVNYTTFPASVGSNVHTEPYCKLVNATKIKSLRHWAASDTGTEALSIYSDVYWGGNEIFVEGKAYAGIQTPMLSVVASGTAEWMVFEGENLDGKSLCLKIEYPNSYFQMYPNVNYQNLSTIGSAFKGCDLREIQEYKEKHM